MAQSSFGAGFLFGIPSGANATPVMFGAVQDVSADFQFDMKQLYGQNQFALEQARGKAKVDIKATVGRLDPNLFNALFFGQSQAAGETLNSMAEAITPASASATVANSANFQVDLGVYNPTTGKFYTRVASTPSAGQYSVSAGVYTFNTSENGNSLRAYYTYGSSSTGQTITLANPLMGSGPVFQVKLLNQYKGRSLALTLNACQSSKLSVPLKLDDFTLPQLEISAQDDGTGNIGAWSLTGA